MPQRNTETKLTANPDQESEWNKPIVQLIIAYQLLDINDHFTVV